MGALMIPTARIVALPDPAQNSADSGFRFAAGGGGVDDDHVKIGPLVPAAGGPGAEEDDGLNVGLDRQVPAEIDCGWVGIRVDHGRHLLADAVSSHRRHGMVSIQPARRRQWTWWLSTMVVTGESPGGGIEW